MDFRAGITIIGYLSLADDADAREYRLLGASLHITGDAGQASATTPASCRVI